MEWMKKIHTFKYGERKAIAEEEGKEKAPSRAQNKNYSRDIETAIREREIGNSTECRFIDELTIINWRFFNR